MKAIHIALLWAASFLVYAVILILMYAFVPQGKLFAFYSDFSGPVPGAEWDSIISNVIILGSAAITFLLVWAVAFIFLKKRKG
ncbi:hypothetical protein Entas_2061 [Enterobacter soli]|uniref:hypothetical protein n=1 Tax=Enterobacter soli TaxID=885040 RepID=UPI000223CCA9|nr:hypothetical protein [Enterobacter soli]AEN64796.1 hypothetical protein Entas_2061 [Enterobacter soli]OAT37112.1 hypothetical protein M987_03225 [Enterobacter soli ATCC BAA-2102]